MKRKRKCTLRFLALLFTPHPTFATAHTAAKPPGNFFLLPRSPAAATPTLHFAAHCHQPHCHAHLLFLRVSELVLLLMASKLLIRTGSSLMNQLRLSSAHQNNRIWSSQALSHGHGVEVTPMLFPSVSKHQTAHPLQQNDTESLRQLQSEGIFFPFGLPSLRFFLPDGMLLFLFLLC